MKRVLCNKYAYNGMPEKVVGKGAAQHLEVWYTTPIKLETTAVSLGEAVKNFKDQIRKRAGVKNDVRINLKDSDIQLTRNDEQRPLTYEESKYVHELQEQENLKHCSKCGTLLTDGGYCPICDDGENDYF